MAAEPAKVSERLVDVADDRRADESGLQRLCSALESAGVAYWIDSGVLLGLVRSGRLNPWEKDIDLACLGDDADRLLASSAVFRRFGYRMTVNRYRGVLYSVSLKPLESWGGGLRASVHVYYRIDETLWSPQTQLYMPPPAPDVLDRPPSLAGKLLRAVVRASLYRRPSGDNTEQGEESRVSREPDKPSLARRLIAWLYHRFDRGLIAESWPSRDVYVPLTWVIPAGFVLPLSSLEVDGQRYPVPGDVEAYLSYRYGDWRRPVRNWCYWRDDGAIRRERPLDVRERLRAGEPV
ncbi:LicD family protein [Methylonatrum kenyense]|uniref:LicD family protein n=1 Tax=Methylonatrum kenyense TaxID=455253 RepID=UPI0020BEE42A|nr:LicD family protein [Methylonatrum kenyense]MCK8516973.1 LicD family protein [Methylonatrum kenyense]